MGTASIPVDLLNPGQVFACIGLAEMALVLHGDARGAFDWRDRRNVRFHLATPVAENPVEAVLGFLEKADVVSVAPEGSPNRTESWKVDTHLLQGGDPFPNGDENGPPQLPARLQHGSVHFDIAHWGESMATVGRDGVKLWAGAGGYPGAALVRDALTSVRGKMLPHHADPFNLPALLSSNMRLEKRGSCVPLDAGFAPNGHIQLQVRTFPLVEILAALGLTHARPQRVEKLEYRYGVIGTDKPSLFPMPLLRAAIGAPKLPFDQRTFTMILGWAGKEGQARVITSSVEETSK